ncbi:Putative glycosyltransferase [Magnetospirillum sp. XM-1]|uniref:glycosyltransferase n=1 Tax=Magnetospirillum sp. XM-1 TaxID=1663591 RepID=UPI00073E07E3|nr:glycosyltransferase [Magnetospirillum sp. XM-1]CUW38091.1 Putative glycosyltransferase [Magnetospirillum sp. XM-1]
MRILMNAFSAKRGGILTYTSNMLKSLRDRGVKVVVAVSPEFDLPEGIEAIRHPVANYNPTHRLLWEQLVWPKVVARVNPDVLFSSANFGIRRSPVPQLLLMREGGLFDPFYLHFVAPSQGIKLAAWRFMRRKLMLQSMIWADKVMAPSQAMKDLLAQWQPESAEKVVVNRYGTLDGVFNLNERSRIWREDGVLRLLYVSVYYPHKSPGDVCRLVERLEAAGIRAHATITMQMEDAANSPGGALDLRAMERLSAAGKLTLCKVPYHQLPELYNSHDVFVFPAVAETFGHPMAEALSSGLPVVVADTPVAREVCGDCALYATPFRPEEMLKQVLALDADPALRQRLAVDGRTRVLSDLQWSDHVDRLIGLFETMRR